MWDTRVITEAIAEALKGEEARVAVEQAVHGMDAGDEVSLHPVIAAGLRAAGFGVVREREYPHEWKKKANERRGERVDVFTGEVVEEEEGDMLPQWKERQRCDLVLTHETGVEVGDPVKALKAKKKVVAEGAGLLFEQAAKDEAAGMPELMGEGGVKIVGPEEAFWLEVKMVCQFSNVSHDGGMGVPGPNMSYGSQLVRGVTGDLRKLANDGRIEHGGVALVLFTCDEATAEHDLVVLLHKCLDKGLPIQSPTTERIGIVDRIGNRWCTVAVIPVRG